MASLLLSDLHLPAAASPLRERFIEFLRGPALQAHAVYLLGDIFEHWIGDDVGLEIYAAEIAAIAALKTRGIAVYWMHGNRDFLPGSRFCDATGIRILTDPSIVDIDGESWLLSHGDVFCSDDLGYQRWRRIVRRPWVQHLFLQLPRRFRLAIAQGMRSRSTQAKASKTAQIMDVNPQAIEQVLGGKNVRGLIHGHTHRPQEHRHRIGGRDYVRLVLADWRADHQEYLELGQGHWQRVVITQASG